MPTIKYWQNWGNLRILQKRIFLKNTVLVIHVLPIGGNLFTRHLKNINHVQKDSNNRLSVIIILGTDFHGYETILFNGMNMNDIRKRAHFLKH